MLAANHCQINTTTFLASGTNHVRAEARTRHHTGNADLSEIRLGYAGFYLTNGSGIEANVPNSVSLQVALEWEGIGTVQFTFNGLLIGTISSALWVYTDPIRPSQFGLSKFPKNTQFWVRRLSEVTQTQRYGRHESSSAGVGERTVFSDGLSASQLLGTGTISVPAGGADASAILGPNLILGRPVGAADIAVAFIGDSIMTGSNDSGVGGDGEIGGGWGARGLWSVNSRKVPWVKLSVGGATAQNLLAGTKWVEALRFCTHAVVEPCTNDMAVASRSAAQADADNKGIQTLCKAAGIRWVDQVLCMPRVATTDSGATVVNQTPVTGFETGGARRDAYNTLAATLGAHQDGVFDLNPTVADVTDLDRWKAGYSNDGVHLTSTGHIAAGTAFATRAASYV